jgi:hypothetical protein
MGYSPLALAKKLAFDSTNFDSRTVEVLGVFNLTCGCPWQSVLTTSWHSVPSFTYHNPILVHQHCPYLHNHKEWVMFCSYCVLLVSPKIPSDQSAQLQVMSWASSGDNNYLNTRKLGFASSG